MSTQKGSRCGAVGHRVVGGLLLGLCVATAAAQEAVHVGAPVAVGQGSARVMIATDAAGEPSSIAVVLEGASLEGLPQDADHGHATEYRLPLPASAPVTGYSHVGLDWNPRGHLPEGVYSVPHFDVHFYLVDAAERAAITFVGDAAAAAFTPPDPTLVPAGYVIPPEGAVEHMGLNGVDPAGPEFAGEPFRYTFIWGYYAGEQVFLEPMVSLDALRTKGDVTLPVPQPAAFSRPGYYPTRYRIGYDAERDEHRVALAGLRRQAAPPVAAR